MPRGKIVKDNATVQPNEDVMAGDEFNDSRNASKFTIVEPESVSRDVHDEAGSSPIDLLDRGNSNTLNFKFTLLLVALFVAVNIGLVALLDENKTTTTKPEEKSDNAATQNTDASSAANAQDKAQPQNNTVDENTATDKPTLGNMTTNTNASKTENNSSTENNPSTDDHPAAKSADVQPAEPQATEQTAQPATVPAAEPAAKQEEKQQPAATEQQDLLSIISKEN